MGGMRTVPSPCTLQTILANLPPHILYVEPLGGGAFPLLQKPPTTAEVYNDLDSTIITFFRMLRDPKQFQDFTYQLFLLETTTDPEPHQVSNTPKRIAQWFLRAKASLRVSSWERSSAPQTILRMDVAETYLPHLIHIDGLYGVCTRLLRVQMEQFLFL
ncbi:hypothetical protein [Candidatus Caldatribacterium sp.]|uniref:hypothetical protein n=1 Tax=Candidatus Caldatribacterium sp. TaxID=2282143 RepID=UPI003849E9D5|nr:hypothetical protein [Candidatus Caldatribacterium sp.]